MLPLQPVVPFVVPRLPLQPVVPFVVPRLPLLPLVPFGPGPGPEPGPLSSQQGMAITAEDIAALEKMMLDSGE